MKYLSSNIPKYGCHFSKKIKLLFDLFSLKKICVIISNRPNPKFSRNRDEPKFWYNNIATEIFRLWQMVLLFETSTLSLSQKHTHHTILYVNKLIYISEDGNHINFQPFCTMPHFSLFLLPLKVWILECNWTKISVFLWTKI